MTKPRLLFIVTARGGSKRLPRKNLKVLGGHSLIAHTAIAIRQSGLEGIALLSTDDVEIAEEGRRHGLEVPFLRPPELATDAATSLDVVGHALDWYLSREGVDPEFVFVLQPTSPLRGSACIRVGLEVIMKNHEAGSVVSMNSLNLPPRYMFGVDEHGHAISLREDGEKPVLYPNGALYITRVSRLRMDREIYARPIIPLVLDARRGVDIDTQSDWEHAEALMAYGLPAEPSDLSSFLVEPAKQGRSK